MICDIKTGQELTARELLGHLAAAAHVLVGAAPDEPDHLAMQLWLLHGLTELRTQGSVLLPMLESGQQARVTAIQSEIARGEFAEDLPTALNWPPEWDWALHGSLMRYALAQPAAVLGAALSADEVQAIERRPQRLSGSHSTSATVRHQLLEQLGLGQPEQASSALLAVHQQRDRRMAQQLLAAPGPALLFAAVEHVRKDIGVPLHLADLGEQRAPVVLIFACSDQPLAPEAADYVWYISRPSQQEL